ncbi:hypothetical protein K469DRAFT_691130 [Zopfia rhizophila CBS 207.26]|uniref:Uncharacterized protein n=1 Tax=Zopfia rhizophila CBS 207.26 TaxID=1314779 RepID=A0A6A6ES23_9PEZI|nr:hypothetical protein K469DRAFT_691130 [Zopfia rhizophila CBS 207.26]
MSFFEDVKFIRPIVKAMKQLLADYSQGESFEGTIDVALTDCFYRENQTEGVLKLQQSDTEFTAVSGTAADQPDLVKECPRTEKGAKKLTPWEPQEVKWYVFALLARQFGYSSNRIRQLTSQTPSQEFQPVLPDLSGRPLFTTHDSGETLQRRCGRVFQNAYTADRRYLFLDMLYNHHQGIGKGISSFYVRQSVWFAFFKAILPSQIASNVLISNPFRSLIDVGHLEELHGILAVASTSQATAGCAQNSGSQPESTQNDEWIRHELHLVQRNASLDEELADRHAE